VRVALSMTKHEENIAAANKLFVEAIKHVKSVEEEILTIDLRPQKAVALEKALRKINMIIDDYPSTDLAVKLISGTGVGGITLADITKEAARAWEESGAYLERMEELAEQGDAESQKVLGDMYRYGRGGQDADKALEWYHKSAEQGHAAAQLELGHIYYIGTAVSKNDFKALRWYRKSAEQGHTLGNWYLEILEAK